MLTVHPYARIRQLHRDGLTIRRIAAQLGHSPNTILKPLKHPEPVRTVRTEPRTAPVFGPFRAVVDAIVAADEAAPRKQRHPARQIYRRPVAEHGYVGSYDPIRRHLKARRLDRRETFLPLDHRPGVRAAADFGHIQVDFPDGRRQVPVRPVTWSYSNAPFALALPTDRTAAILHGLVEAFAFFGCVPRERWSDNPATVAGHVLPGRERALHPRYAALASHYPLTPNFCPPATPTEKPPVENRVYDLQRQWATPVPRVTDLAALSAHRRRCRVAARGRTWGDDTRPVGERFERDRAAALAAPERAFDACIVQPARVDTYQTVRSDDNRYSVPRRWAFRPVTVKGYVDRVAVVADGQVVASHPRTYGRRGQVLDPLHLLAVPGKKPAALDHAPVYRDWHLPPAFARLRQSLEARLGASAGSRQYIRVLHLLARHPRGRVERAIALCRGEPDATAVAAAVERLAPTPDPPAGASDTRVSLPSAPRPDLTRFDLLVSRSPHGGPDGERPERPAAEGQPEAAEAADHAGRVGEAGP